MLRIFIDTCVLRWMYEFGEFLSDGGELPYNHKLMHKNENINHLEGLFDLLILSRIELIDLVISESVLDEITRWKDPAFRDFAAEWMFYVSEKGTFFEEMQHDPHAGLQAAVVTHREYRYLSRSDCILLHDAIFLGCNFFLTVDRKLTRNAVHIHNTLGIQIMTPRPMASGVPSIIHLPMATNP